MRREGFSRAAARVWVILLASMALTGGYLVIPARSRMDATTTGVVLLHVCLGVVTLLALPVELIRRFIAARFPSLIGGAGCLLAIGGITGATMLVAAARGAVASDTELRVHVVSVTASLVLIGAVLVAR